MNNETLRNVLTNALNELVSGQIDTHQATAIARLSSVILKSAIAGAKFSQEAQFFTESPQNPQLPQGKKDKKGKDSQSTS
jgi:hypothetical protein